MDLERRELAAFAKGGDGGGDVLRLVEPTLVGERDASHARDAGYGIRHLAGRTPIFGFDDHIPGDARDVRDGMGAQGAMEVRDELVLEGGAILPLEAYLVVVNQAESFSHMPRGCPCWHP